MKTNAIRILESRNISYTAIEYQTSEEEIDAVSVAHKINAAPEIVFKTLVARNERNEILVFVIPGNFELNLKKAAKVSNSKNIEMIKVKELQSLTGYIRGGCSPIGMKKLFPTFIDETAQLHDKIYCSAGVRGMQILINGINPKAIRQRRIGNNFAVPPKRDEELYMHLLVRRLAFAKLRQSEESR